MLDHRCPSLTGSPFNQARSPLGRREDPVPGFLARNREGGESAKSEGEGGRIAAIAAPPWLLPASFGAVAPFRGFAAKVGHSAFLLISPFRGEAPVRCAIWGPRPRRPP